MATPKKPASRNLRGYAFDPSLSLKVDTFSINELTYSIPWEEMDSEEGVSGDYVEIVDYDPTTQQYYTHINLNDPYVLAMDGLDPSESNPEFHQQMVYAVVMTTIKHFEKALGRKVLWAPRRLADPDKYEEYVAKLRIYPHALREANAYYSPNKKALLFGYFSASPADPTLYMPGSLVFTCLSHDIIAHETTHAILDGMHRHYNEPTNPDVLAFHEAFADIVALFQHFSFPEVLKHQISETRGNLSSENLLGQLAQQFGFAIGQYGSLRDAIGEVNKETGKWELSEPDPNDYHTTMEPHARGSILVSAVFEAFLAIYKRRVADLMRIASNGTGILPQGNLHPDLVNRLADEAAKSASHVLSMCIRALDYCPPVDITFGEYLRAIITADVDLIANDDRAYRLAFIDAFRRRGIYPEGIKTLSVDSLRYEYMPKITDQSQSLVDIITEFLREYAHDIVYINDREEIYNMSKRYIAGDYDSDKKIYGLHRRIGVKFGNSTEFQRLTGLAFMQDWMQHGIRASRAYGNDHGPSFSIQNLRLVSRIGPSGNKINQVVFTIVQRAGIVMENGEFKGHFEPSRVEGVLPEGLSPNNAFEFKSGCTLIFDLDSLQLKYAIPKPLLVINSETNQIEIDRDRIERQWRFSNGDARMGITEYERYFTEEGKNNFGETFAMLHQH